MQPYYEQDGIVIYHGDCRDVLREDSKPYIPHSDLLLTDPPYGIGEANGKGKSRNRFNAKEYEALDWDAQPPSTEVLTLARSAATTQIIFGGNYFHLPPSSCWLVWDKDNGACDFADCELAWTNMDKAVRMIKYRWNGMIQEHMGSRKESRSHPTQKPLDVMKWCIQQAPNTVQNILDPFMGSGTTLVAAKLAGLKATGIELEEKYCEIAANRLSQGVFDFTD